MKILIGTGASEPERCTSKCFIAAAKKLGHEICLAGPIYGREDTGIPAIGVADIDLPDKPYPETYEYEDILSQCPWKPDFILQIEPHFYFTGKKPDDIKSYYWVLDPHRGGVGHRDMALKGNFDGIFITQPFFMESYLMHDLKMTWLPQALDTNRIKCDPKVVPECDMAFVGETGIHPDLLQFEEYDKDGFAYLDKLPDRIILRSEHREYAERAQLIGFLMENFDLRIYAPQTGNNYSKVMQKGEIGFHRSLFNDIALRTFEILACNRLLVTDIVPLIDQVFEDKKHCLMYKQYGYDPFLPNFKLDYEQLYNAVEYALNNTERFEIADCGYKHVLKNHTYENRVNTMIEVVNG